MVAGHQTLGVTPHAQPYELGLIIQTQVIKKGIKHWYLILVPVNWYNILSHAVAGHWFCSSTSTQQQSNYIQVSDIKPA